MTRAEMLRRAEDHDHDRARVVTKAARSYVHAIRGGSSDAFYELTLARGRVQGALMLGPRTSGQDAALKELLEAERIAEETWQESNRAATQAEFMRVCGLPIAKPEVCPLCQESRELVPCAHLTVSADKCCRRCAGEAEAANEAAMGE